MRVFKPDLRGITRCVDCGVKFGEEHLADALLATAKRQRERS